ncbi:MAG: hypothetical protein K8R58_11805 [Bacteroidales bacterium]|nr:hypothetical protein [Bacteroidales bacterium]
MKSIKNIISLVCIVSIFLFIAQNSYCQNQAEEVIKKAMEDEINRNINNLTLQDLKKPFFISYTISDAKTLSITSTLGAIISSNEIPYRNHKVRVMVGDYERNNENYVDMKNMTSFSGTGSVPLDNDYDGIKRSLWEATDNNYKDAAEIYEAKISSIKQQNLTEEEANLHDFSLAPKVNLNIKTIAFDFNKEKWEKTAKELSGVFNNYSDIFSSKASIYFYKADVYFINTEGTEVKSPLSLAAIRINALTQADDGEAIYDHLLYYALSPEDLPSLDEMKAEVKTMADNLITLKNAPIFDDFYSGPVLFEGQAAAEVFTQRLFSGTNGLLAMRKPIFSEQQMAMMMGQLIGQTLENKIDKKIISNDITIKAEPKLKTYKGEKLIGSFSVDAEGVIPDDELILVEKGILKTLLNGRTPTEKIKKSNGYNRYSIQTGGMISSGITPGIITVNSANGISKDELKEKLIEAAKDEGLDYAIIIRKLESPNSGIEKDIDPLSAMSMGSGDNKNAVSKPIYVYRVSLEDGEEELVRTVELGGISTNTFKKIIGFSDKQFIYNTLLSESVGGLNLGFLIYYMSGGGLESLSGTPASFIVPDAFLVEYLDVQQEKRAITKKLPVVENPVGN